jgi:hypothetical protein
LLVVVVASVLAMAALLSAAPVAAQNRQEQQRQDTTKTREQLIRERLRSLGPIVKPDSAADTTVIDSLNPPPQQVRFEPREGAQGREAITGLTDVRRDSIMERLLELSGYIPTEYKGDAARYQADSARLDLRGNAEVVTRGQRVTADSSIVYQERLSFTCAYGSPVVSGAGVDSPIQSDSLCYDLTRNVGVARGARTEVSQGAVWYVSGDLVTINNSVYSHDAVFTDCSEEEPHYHFGAGRMKVLPNNVMVARDVTLRFADVPVFWLPFFVQSLSQGRRSGILFPRFGINDIARTNARYSRRIEDVGFYWAINDYLGAEVALDWQSDNWTGLRGSFDYRFLRNFFEGAVTFRRFWRVEGRRDFTLATRNGWQPDERTRISIDANYATSTEFIRTRSYDPRELNQSIDSNLGLNRRFDWGSVSMGATRQQFLNDGSVRTTPSVNLSLNSITLFRALPGEERWFSNATWTGSAQARLQRRDIDEGQARFDLQDDNELSANFSNSFTLGKFSLSQGFQLTDRELAARSFDEDTVEDLAQRIERRAEWNASLSFQQRLIGTTSFTPGLRMAGQIARDSTDGSMISGPTRIDFNASLNTDLFAFLPGAGPFERVRHRLSPNISYSYSPEPTVTPRQELVFGRSTLREQNRISIGLSQTFEAKFKPGRGPQARAQRGIGTPADSLRADSLRAAGDTLAADSIMRALVADTLRADTLAAAQDTSTGPRRRETGEKITLLSISTDALVYDFVQAREENRGIQTLTIGNNIQSDLLRGLQFSFTHDLFRTLPLDPPDPTDPTDPVDPPSNTPVQPDREFAPHLSRVSASFSLNSDSWIARVLGLGARNPSAQRDTLTQQQEDTGAGPAIDRTESEQGLIGTRRRGITTSPPPSSVGTWNASFSYSLERPRETSGLFGARENQMLTGNISYQATENWSLHWNTGFSFTQGEFTDHALTLTRRLHDFDANFDFYKAQNGNFSFQFRVHLRANPDLKLDYEQRDLPALDRVIR